MLQHCKQCSMWYGTEHTCEGSRTSTCKCGLRTVEYQHEQPWTIVGNDGQRHGPTECH